MARPRIDSRGSIVAGLTDGGQIFVDAEGGPDELACRNRPTHKRLSRYAAAIRLTRRAVDMIPRLPGMPRLRASETGDDL
jgi:hypothetical protein